MPLILGTYYDHRCHQILPSSNPRGDGASDFISEDDLDTWEGFLRWHHVDPQTATPDALAAFSAAV